MRAGSMDVEETKAAILKAEQAIVLMDSRLQHKLRPEHKRALANAILRSGAQDDLVFHHQTMRKTPRWWTLGGLLGRVCLLWEVKVRKHHVGDVAERISDWAARIRRSGLRRLLIAALIGLICGLINFGLPAEMELQALRDKTRPIKASGDIVVVAKDEISRKAFGELPWSRKYDAMLLDRLRELGAKRIVFNEAFDREMDPAGDDQFIKALDRARGKVWLGAYYDYDQRSGRQIDFFPHPKFKMNCCVAHSLVWHDPFGNVAKISFHEKIGNSNRPSSAFILSGSTDFKGDLRPDAAVQVDTIPTISAIDLLTKSFDRSYFLGKSILISPTSNILLNQIKFNGQGYVSSAFVKVVAAETINRGAPLQAGWQLCLLIFVVTGLICIRTKDIGLRFKIMSVGFFTIIFLFVLGIRAGFDLQIVPAIASLLIFATRDRMQSRLLIAETSDPISGLPSLSELNFVRGRDRCVVGALKVERFSTHIAQQDVSSQRDFVRAIASRVNIIFPDSVIHQGGDGLFVWLFKLGDDYDPLGLIAQLTALFRIPIGVKNGTFDVGIAVGFGSDFSEPFAGRLAVASDRARVSLYGTLTSVK